MFVLSRFALAFALTLGAQPAAADQQGRPAAASAAPKPGEMQMSAVTLTVIIKDAIIALNQANATGNYSVLRDMGTPVLRESFDQTALAAAFVNLRARKIDLSPAYFLSPNLTKKPELNKDNELVLVWPLPNTAVANSIRIKVHAIGRQMAPGRYRGRCRSAIRFPGIGRGLRASGPCSATGGRPSLQEGSGKAEKLSR